MLDRGKRSVVLDLQDGAAHEQLLALARRAEVFVESWRPGVAERLGLGYDVLHARNPALVYCSISGFGEAPTATCPATSPSCRRSSAAWCDQVGHRDGPIYHGFPFASIGAATLAVIGTLAALYAAARTDSVATSRPRCSTAPSRTTR